MITTLEMAKNLPNLIRSSDYKNNDDSLNEDNYQDGEEDYNLGSNFENSYFMNPTDQYGSWNQNNNGWNQNYNGWNQNNGWNRNYNGWNRNGIYYPAMNYGTGETNENWSVGGINYGGHKR